MIEDYKAKKASEARKKILIQLSKDIEFESKIFPLEFKFNSKEPLRFYLWMCEMVKWLYDIHGIRMHTTKVRNVVTNEELQEELIRFITDFQKVNWFKTKLKEYDCT
jgi:hypothetical protein